MSNLQIEDGDIVWVEILTMNGNYYGPAKICQVEPPDHYYISLAKQIEFIVPSAYKSKQDGKILVNEHVTVHINQIKYIIEKKGK